METVIIGAISERGSDGDIYGSVEHVEVDLTEVGESVIKSFIINLNPSSARDREVLKVTCTYICL